MYTLNCKYVMLIASVGLTHDDIGLETCFGIFLLQIFIMHFACCERKDRDKKVKKMHLVNTTRWMDWMAGRLLRETEKKNFRFEREARRDTSLNTKGMILSDGLFFFSLFTTIMLLGWVARSMVSAYHWLRTYRLPWHLTRVSANHASSNWAQTCSIPGVCFLILDVFFSRLMFDQSPQHRKNCCSYKIGAKTGRALRLIYFFN